MWPIDVVAFWNGAQMRDLLEAIVFIVGGSDFAGLARTAVLVGLLAAVLAGIVRWRHESMYMFIVVFVVAAMVLLVPRTTVTVRDVRAGTVYVVGNVPVGAAFLVTLSSRVGYWLGNTFETAFIPPGEEAARFTRFGMAFPQRAAEAIRSIGAVTPTGRGFLNALMSECVVIEMIENPARAQDVFSSPNLEATILSAGWLNPARHVVGPDGIARSCPDLAYHTIGYLRATELPEVQRLLGAQLVGMESNPAAAVTGAIASAETTLLNLSRTFGQAAMQSILRAGVGDGLQQSSHPDAMALASAFAAAQANVSSVINYRTMAKIAETLLPTLRNAIEFVALAAFPIVIVLVMAGGIGGAVLLRGYVMIFAWLALWPPLYAVVNYLMVRVDGSPMARLLTAYGGDTMVAAKLIQHMGASSQDMAGMLAIMVPVIAFALVRGGDIAASNLVSGIVGPASSAAQSQGGSLAQGNVSMGNVAWSSASMNRVEGNSMNLVPNVTYGMGGSFQNAYGAHATNLGGGVTAARLNPIDLGAAAHVDASRVAQQAESSAVAAHLGRAVHASIADARTANLSANAAWEQTRFAIEALNKKVGASAGSETFAGTGHGTGGGNSITTGEGGGTTSLGQVGIGGGGGSAPGRLGPGAGKAAGATAVSATGPIGALLGALSIFGSSGVNVRADDYRRAARELKGFSQADIQEGARQLRAALEEVANNNSDQATRSGARRLVAALDDALTAMRTEGVGLTQTDSASRSLSVTTGSGTRLTFDLNGLVLQAAAREYGSVDAAMQAARTDPVGYQARMNAALDRELSQIGDQIVSRIAGDLRSPEEIMAAGRGEVEQAAAQNAGRVNIQGDQNKETVSREQTRGGVVPGTPVPQDGRAAYKAETAAIKEEAARLMEQAQLAKGAAAALYQMMESPKWERLWDSTKDMFVSNRPTVGPATLLREMTEADHELRAVLLKAANGARLSEPELNMLGDRLKAARR